ncbi:hypothetical protein DFQ27_004347 [Actinomortierella ambigua]|uniref:Uncharacterized protein n=1 Tax=Actinomortierella ambigua TaxID=1343610 RepID=A0A9P6Q3F2_9FUNG|nr:hypothetical protein DFQ27_004347 [Actinomortierella ambigua]
MDLIELTYSAEHDHNANAMMELAQAHESGKILPRHASSAFAWYLKAAKRGLPRAQHYLANKFFEQHYDLDQPLERCSSEALKGDTWAQCCLGFMYQSGHDGVKVDFAEAVSWYLRAAKQGYAFAQHKLGDLYQYRVMKDGDERVSPESGGLEPNLAEALHWRREAATLGHMEAMSLFAAMYYDGTWVDQSYSTAMYWFRLAANKGHRESKYYLGKMYYDGVGVGQNYPEAAVWFRQAALDGHSWSQLILGHMHQFGQGVLKSDCEAVEWYLQAGTQGNAVAQYTVGWMMDHGLGTLRDEHQAVSWYAKGVYRGNVLAIFCLGTMYELGIAVDRSDDMARSLFQDATDIGHEDAPFHLASLGLADRASSSQTDAEMVAWYRQKAEEGDVSAQFNMGLMYEKGALGLQRNVLRALEWYGKANAQGHTSAKDRALGAFLGFDLRDLQHDLARFWYSKAANQGHPVAQYRLAGLVQRMSLTHDHDDDDDDDDNDDRDDGNGNAVEAIQLYQDAAQQGYSLAQYELGRMFQQGRGVEQCHTEAMRWFRIAAIQGCLPAQLALGAIYATATTTTTTTFTEKGDDPNSDGLHPDHTKAAYWYRQAAEQGDALAQSKMAEMYDFGQGVEKPDSGLAAYFARKSANQGNPEAQFRLGLAYELGFRVPRSLDEARAWYRKAASQGLVDADAHLQLLLLLEKETTDQNVEAPTDREAVKWYRQQAKREHDSAIVVAAQYSLGFIHEKGLFGVDVNTGQAIALYQGAAAEGHVHASQRWQHCRTRLNGALSLCIVS